MAFLQMLSPFDHPAHCGEPTQNPCHQPHFRVAQLPHPEHEVVHWNRAVEFATELAAPVQGLYLNIAQLNRRILYFGALKAT